MGEDKPIQETTAAGAGRGGVKLSEEQSKKLKYFISAPLRSANRLLKQLYSDDYFYETATYAWVGEEDAKKLFCSRKSAPSFRSAAAISLRAPSGFTS